MGEVLLKIHESYRWVVAVCDSYLFGKKLVQGNKVLDLTGQFFEGKVMSLEEAKQEMINCHKEDATFNIVGKKSVNLAKELGLVKDEGIITIDGVPFALVLL